MTADVIANAVDVLTQVRRAGGRQSFERAVGRFAELIERVPDAVPADLSVDQIGLLQTFSEEVIERIETRVADATVCGPPEQVLINRLYQIRRLLEEIHQWHRHRGLRRPS